MTGINLPLAATTWGDEEFEALQAVIASGYFTMGQHVQKFEQEFAEFFGSKHAIMVNSGSSANLIAVAALAVLQKGKFKKGSNVIVPAVSWATTYYPVSQYGLELKFVDISPDTLCMDIDEVEAAIDEKTAAIFAVNLLGQPADLPALKKICDARNVILIEDNCESMGAEIEGKYCGTWGVMGTFSTFFSHHISTMEGGVVVTDDLEIAETLRSLRAHGWTRDLSPDSALRQKKGTAWDDLFTFVLPGYNVRPLEFEGALGSRQLEKLPALLNARKKNAESFIQNFRYLENIRIQSGKGVSSWFGFSLILEGPLRGQRSELLAYLEDLGVETRPIVSGNFTKQPVMKHLPHTVFGSLDVANELDENGFFIGNHHFDIGEELTELADAIKGWITKKVQK